jgi:nucleoside transporter
MKVASLATRCAVWLAIGLLLATIFASPMLAHDPPAGADAASVEALSAETPAADVPAEGAPAESAKVAEPKPPLAVDMRIRLSALHFLEFAVWGAWWVVLGQYLEVLRFTRKSVGNIYATMSLAAIISPLFIAALADRYFASERVLGVLHLAGGLTLLALAYVTRQRTFFWVTLLYSLLYTPTMTTLTNALTFSHVPDSNDFPLIRVFGTLGWIAANLSLKLLLKPGQPMNNRPILLAAGLSFCLALFSFWLPHTPPHAGASPLEAFALLKEPSFAIFFGMAFLISLALAFYYSFTAIFLEKKVGVRSDNVGPLMTLGQWVEVAVMFSLPFFLTEFGIKWVLALGMAAWGVRYGFFALGKPFVLILLGIALHGICFDFFFTGGFIHVNNIAPKDISNSAQGLFGVVTYGLGMYLGTEASGWLNQYLTREVADPKTGTIERVTDWRMFWAIPAVSILVSVVLFLVLFREQIGPVVGAG